MINKLAPSKIFCFLFLIIKNRIIIKIIIHGALPRKVIILITGVRLSHIKYVDTKFISYTVPEVILNNPIKNILQKHVNSDKLYKYF